VLTLIKLEALVQTPESLLPDFCDGPVVVYTSTQDNDVGSPVGGIGDGEDAGEVIAEPTRGKEVHGERNEEIESSLFLPP